ncbi:MAG: MBL fold metallo-hydrolase [Candidatus Pacebacteria bacterium]|nr:MBL fold metallo-hydrolase [Candidatus Paceibacterota bacterium]
MQNSKTVVIRKILLGFFLVITIFIWYGVLAENRDGLMTVAFLDIGQGDSIFIETPSGKQILLDSGSNKKVLQELAKQMPFYDRSIDVLIESHPDLDHIGGFPSVLSSYEIDFVFSSGVNCDKAICEEFEKEILEEGIEEKTLTRGDILSLGDGIYLEVLFPDRDASGFEANLASLVLKLVYGKNSFLLTGDSPKVIEEYLISLDGENLDVDVLKLGHHGSKTSTGDYFIGMTSPEVAVISVGGDNSYGHPHQEVLDILNNFEIEVLRTDELGTIIIQSDGKNLIY